MVNGYHHDVAAIVAQAQDPQLIEAILLIFAKLIMSAAIALVISTFSTSFIFTVITTAMIYLVGHLESTARDVWLQGGAQVSVLAERLPGNSLAARAGHELVHHRR